MATNEHLDRIKEKLAKMMAKEESARELGNQAEAEAFAAKIQDMLLQYELDLGDIKRNTAESIAVDKEMFDTETLTNPHESNWVVHLYNACSRANFCKILVRNATGTNITIIGTDMNREFLHFMVHQLVPKIRHLAKGSWLAYGGPEKRNTFIRGFLKGCCRGIATKLNLDLFAQQKNQEQVNALVVQKDRAVQQWMDTHIGRVRSVGMNTGSGRHGYDQGVEAGKNININKGVGQGRGMGGTRLLN
jgi:hypothetical protein